MAESGEISFPKKEEEVLALWKELDAFQQCLKQSKTKPRYVFFDGPPFATGLPHYGHILAGTVKDIVTRWAHQSGYHVVRRFGWDCHGLPVEYEIDKKLEIKGPDDVQKMGIKAYNAECRKIVMRYSEEWERIVTRLGRWIDFKNDYKTMYPTFMESIWWVFKQLYDKGMVYRGFKVMPFSTACNTPLSNFESGQNYKEVVDPAVIVSFPLKSDPSVSLIAWTTTPWTLPSNISVCVNPEMEYCKVEELSTGRKFLMMEARLSALFKKEEEYKILQKMAGSKLEGLEYEPLFDYFQHMRKRGAFKVLCDGYVTSDTGTGIVHQAPYFGEEDYKVVLKNGIITKDMDPLCPVDFTGKFVDPVTHFKGMYVKDADKHICKHLKEKQRLVHQSTTKHSYPFCWRSDTPLLYRAVPSWFIRVEQMVDRLLSANDATYWVPSFVKEKRFGNWLRDARDWAVSRNRYWGTPIPLWISDDGQEIVCIGSIQELRELTGRSDITDLHRESIDDLTIPSRRPNGGVLRRVPEVFDCWFESGSMPFAQSHYPFENAQQFEDVFPGDFVAEGIDQTRGWFYTLVVISTALFGKAPFKNLICHGLVLAKDGQKMSKRKKNYPDPMDVVKSYGADAVRLYLVNSPVVRADNLRFDEKGVRDVVKDVFLPWYNAYKFLLQNIQLYEQANNTQFRFRAQTVKAPVGYMDRWIVSFTQSLLKFVKEEMAAYRLYTVVPRLLRFVDQLTNWYVRMNRRRLKGEGGADDCVQALETLFRVLLSMTTVMAMYQGMRPYVQTTQDTEAASIHYLMIPTPREELIEEEVESAVALMQSVIELGRVVRDRNTLPMKYPLPEVVVIHNEQKALERVRALEGFIREELNVRAVTTTQDMGKYNVRIRAEPDHKVLGARVKNAFKDFADAIRALKSSEIEAFRKSGKITLLGTELGAEDLRLMYEMEEGTGGQTSKYQAHSDQEVLILLDVTPSQDLVEEGLAREVINRIQRLRQKAKLLPTDDITVFYHAAGDLQGVVERFAEFIHKTVKQPLKQLPLPGHLEPLAKAIDKVKSDQLELVIVRSHVTSNTSRAANDVITNCGGDVTGGASTAPFCRYVNVQLVNCKPELGARGTMATVLLENPKGDFLLSFEELLHQVRVVFGLQRRKLRLSRDCKGGDIMTSQQDVLSLHGSTIYAFKE